MKSSAITEGPIVRTLVTLAWPVIAGEALHTAFHLVDIAWVGPLGPQATAAVMTSMFTLWIAFALVNLVGVGLGAHVSRAVGAGRRDTAGPIVAHALWLSLLLGVPVAILTWFGAHALFERLVEDPQVADAGGTYLQLTALGLPFSFLYFAAAAAMRACGNTRMPLLLGGAGVVANAALAPLLIYGVGPFPEMGVAGSAVATALCQVAIAAGFLVVALKRHPDLPIDVAALRRPRVAAMLDLARVGIPYFGVGALYSLVYLWYSHVASFFGAAALAVLGIGNRLESMTYLSADGFAVATSTFVGQNLGAKDPSRAESGAWKAAGIMAAAGAIVALVMLLLPGQLMRLFTADADAVALGVPWLRALAACQIFMGLEGVIGGAFAGAGDTVPPMIIHVGIAILRIPLASWSALDGPLLFDVEGMGWGPMGIAWTMVGTAVLRSLALVLWFRRGRWKHRELRGSFAPLPPDEAPDAVGG